MKNFKSILAAALALTTLLAMSTTAFAADLNQDTQSGEAKVVYKAGQTTDDNDTPDDPSDDTVGGTYVVTIPDFINVADVDGQMEEEDVIAKDVLIPYGTNLSVNVAFSDSVVLKDNADTKLTYDMKVDGEKVNTGDTIMTVAAGDPDTQTTVKIGAILTQAPDYAGVYQDTATFTVAVA